MIITHRSRCARDSICTLVLQYMKAKCDSRAFGLIVAPFTAAPTTSDSLAFGLIVAPFTAASTSSDSRAFGLIVASFIVASTSSD